MTLALSILLVPAVVGADPSPAKPMALPTEYVEHRFYVTPVLADGTRLRCYTDSGGGGAFLFEDRARALKLERTTKTIDGEKLETVAWPRFRAGAAIPPPVDASYFIVMPRERFPAQTDCFLGQSWFGGRVWTFDYPGKTLWWRAPGDVPAHDKSHEVALGFKKVGTARENQFPRIEVTIDGEKIPLLFDTGAMVTLSLAARVALGDNGPAVRGGSFITARTFDKWRKRHPTWRVLADADEIGKGKLPMIEVPEAIVGGFTVGPVWFAMRPDKNFDEFMSSFTGEHVEGALGGSALRYLRVTVDYPNAIAVVEKP